MYIYLLFYFILFVLYVHTHMSVYMCVVGTSIVVRGQLVEVTFPPPSVWVLGTELRCPDLSSGAVTS